MRGKTSLLRGLISDAVRDLRQPGMASSNHRLQLTPAN